MKQILQALSLLLIISLTPAVSSANQAIKVVTTTNILADSLRAILPGHFEVDALMSSGIDPHLYRATHGDIKRLLNADFIVYNGLHLEGRMQEPLDKLKNKKPVLVITDAISTADLIYVGPDQADPHIWMDIPLWREGLAYLAESIKQLYPDQRSGIQKKWLAYDQKLRALDQSIQQYIQRIPNNQKILITAHDAFAYFGKRYGMNVDALQGISTVSEFGLKDIQRLKQKITQHNIRAIFLESTISPRFIQSLQSGLNADDYVIQLGGTLHSDSLDLEGTPAGTYLGMMRHNAATISNALTPPSEASP